MQICAFNGVEPVCVGVSAVLASPSLGDIPGLVYSAHRWEPFLAVASSPFAKEGLAEAEAMIQAAREADVLDALAAHVEELRLRLALPPVDALDCEQALEKSGSASRNDEAEDDCSGPYDGGSETSQPDEAERRLVMRALAATRLVPGQERWVSLSNWSLLE